MQKMEVHDAFVLKFCKNWNGKYLVEGYNFCSKREKLIAISGVREYLLYFIVNTNFVLLVLHRRSQF